MLPAIVLAALIASGMILSQRDAVSSNTPPPSAVEEPAPGRRALAPTVPNSRLNVYADPGMQAASKKADNRAGARADARRDAVPAGTVYSPLRGTYVPVEDMQVNAQPFYRGQAPGPLRDRETATVPDPKRETEEWRGWNSQEQPATEAVLNRAQAAVASSLSSTRQGELLMQPYRDVAPVPESVPRQLPPTIDQLRGGARPRYVDKGRVTGAPGSFVSARTNAVNVPRRLPDQYRTNTSADVQPTASPVARQTLWPDPVLAPTARGLGATNYVLPAGAVTPQIAPYEVASTHPGRFDAPAPPIGPAGRANAWDSAKDLSQNVQQYRADLRDNERQALPNGSASTALPLGGMKAAPGATYVTPARERDDWNKKVIATGAPRLYGNLRGAVAMKETIYDPNMVARTTIKETTLHDTTVGIAGPRSNRVQMRAADDAPEPTVRDTLETVDSNLNLAPPVTKATVYDPYDVLEPTMRDTIVEARRAGNVGTTVIQSGQGYISTPYDAKNTQKQFLGDTEYTGIANAQESGQGYRTNAYDAKNTAKQFIGDAGATFGPGGLATSKASMSYADIYAAQMRCVKESLLAGRAPTHVGPKVYKGADDQDLAADCRRDPIMEAADRPSGFVSRQGVTQNVLPAACEQDTRSVNAVPPFNFRHDGFTETASLRGNPYAQDVTRDPIT